MPEARRAVPEPAGEAEREARLEEHRRYMRRYMRRWRADPSRHAKERARSRELYVERKARQGPAERARQPFTNAAGRRVCGFCRRRERVRDVPRLQACEGVPGGFVKVRVPYCGEC